MAVSTTVSTGTLEDYHVHLYLRVYGDIHRNTSVQLGDALLHAAAHDFGDGHAGDANLGKSGLQCIEAISVGNDGHLLDRCIHRRCILLQHFHWNGCSFRCCLSICCTESLRPPLMESAAVIMTGEKSA